MGCTQRLIRTVFLPRFSRLFCLLSSRILQINLLHLYLVTIRRYKLSFFAKPATKCLLACVASVSSQGSSRKLGQAPKKMNEPTGVWDQPNLFVRQIWRQQEVTQGFVPFFGQRSLQDRETIYESRCLRRARLNMICNAAKK